MKRTKNSIINHAHKLNIKSDRFIWSENQLALLKHYDHFGATSMSNLTGKSPSACRKKAQELGYDSHYIEEQKRKQREQEEDRSMELILKEHYIDEGTIGCIKYLEWSDNKVLRYRIYCKAIELGLEYKWTDRDLEILKNNYPLGGLKSCAQLLPHIYELEIADKTFDLGLYSWENDE